MSENTTQTGGIEVETTADAEEAVKNIGVVADGVPAYTEGEGRQTRYFLGDANVAKGEVVGAVAEADEVVPMGNDEDDNSEDDEVESRTRDEALAFVQETVEEHDGCVVTDDMVVSLVTGDEMGYITGSHVKASPAPVETVDEYRQLVVQAMDGEMATDEVPIAPDGLMEKFKSYGDHDEDTIEQLSEQNKARWEDGEYDHLRKDDDEDEDE